MAEVPEGPQGPPEGRYGRASRGSGAGAGSADRGLKIVGAVLGVLLLGMVGWFGYAYVTGADVSGSLIKYQVVSDEAIEVHLEVRKDAGAAGVCTLRAMDPSGAVVGRKDVRVEGGADRIDRVVTLRTTRRATSAELVGCQPAAGG